MFLEMYNVACLDKLIHYWKNILRKWLLWERWFTCCIFYYTRPGEVAIKAFVVLCLFLLIFMILYTMFQLSPALSEPFHFECPFLPVHHSRVTIIFMIYVWGYYFGQAYRLLWLIGMSVLLFTFWYFFSLSINSPIVSYPEKFLKIGFSFYIFFREHLAIFPHWYIGNRCSVMVFHRFCTPVRFFYTRR